MEILETKVVSIDADWDGDKYVDQSEKEEKDLNMDLDAFAAHVKSLMGPKSKLTVHTYMDTLELSSPKDGNDMYVWDTNEKKKIWPEVFSKLGIKLSRDY